MSKAEPYIGLIRKWRRAGVSYVEIARRLSDPVALIETGLPPITISSSSLHNFVRVRALRGLRRKVYELPTEEGFPQELSPAQPKNRLLDQVTSAATGAAPLTPGGLFQRPIQ